MKRLLGAFLWLNVFWYVGSMTAAFLRVPDLLGPALGIAAALIVAVDYRRLFWARPAVPSSPAPAASAA